MFISFEGIEGSGKSTLMAAIERALRDSGHAVISAREPGGTPLGDAVRGIFLRPGLVVDALAETLLINASRAQLVSSVIEPALARGTDVLCDRYVHSTLAYQGFGRGLSLEQIRGICDAATHGVMPDLTLLVDIDLETSARRVAARGDGADRLEREAAAFHRRVREGFLELARRDPRVVLLDGLRSPEELLDYAMAAISAVMQ